MDQGRRVALFQSVNQHPNGIPLRGRFTHIGVGGIDMQESSFTQVRGRLFELESGKVYPHHEIDLLQVDNNDWRYWALGDFSERLNNDRFPCLFGRKAWNGASIRFLFCDLQAEATYGDFLAGLSSYTTF